MRYIFKIVIIILLINSGAFKIQRQPFAGILQNRGFKDFANFTGKHNCVVISFKWCPF